MPKIVITIDTDAPDHEEAIRDHLRSVLPPLTAHGTLTVDATFATLEGSAAQILRDPATTDTSEPVAEASASISTYISPSQPTEPEPDAEVHNAGTEPGAGRYVCTSCGADLTLDSDEDNLPPCAVCGNGQFTKGTT